MKSIFTFLSVLTLSVFSSVQSNGQGCSDLIISEVIEGWSNNKAIEIYNPTAAAIDASDYGLVRFQNGSTTPGNITYLEGVTIEPYDVYVVVLDKRDPDGTSFEAPVWDELQLQADVFVNPSYNDGQEVMYFNGNDAIAIVKDDGQTLVDVFGRIGDSLNPDGWGGYIDAEGEQAYISQDHTLVRKASFTQGYTANPESFDILNEYDSLAANTFDQLGFHICDCETLAGCTDSSACNFDDEAYLDDGSCLTFDECGDCGGIGVAGCTDSFACNYNPEATCDDASCDGFAGCTVSFACNYNPEATCDDASCAEFDECGECGGEGLLGCIDSEACNYNTEASCDDGSCYFLPEVSISGANITTEFTSEIYEVILIEDAVYNWNVSGGVIEGNNDNYQPSIIWASEGIGEICVSIINGICEPIESCINVVIFPGGNITGCTDSEACNYDPEATTDNGNCISIGDPCNDGNTETIDDTIQNNCECEGQETSISGCTDSLACNFNPDATIDDGSCSYVVAYDIIGSAIPAAFSTESYSYTETAGSSYAWLISGGVITSGQGSSSIEVVWSLEGTAELGVQETTLDGCEGEVVLLNIVILPTFIEEMNTTAFEVYPNPAFDSFTIMTKTAFHNSNYYLIDSSGKEVLTGIINSESQLINVTHLTSGYYTILITNGNYSETMTIIVKK